jgi:hypothetical protein
VASKQEDRDLQAQRVSLEGAFSGRSSRLIYVNIQLRPRSQHDGMARYDWVQLISIATMALVAVLICGVVLTL